MTVLRVALDVPIPRLFDYSGPATAVVGSRVLVPFGPKRRVGIVCEHAATTEMPVEKLRPITQVLIDTQPLGADWLALARFAAEYYQRPLGEVILGAIPPRLKRADPVVLPVAAYALTANGHEALTRPARASARLNVLKYLAGPGMPTVEAIDAAVKNGAATVRALAREGLVQPAAAIKPLLTFAGAPKLTAAQQAAVTTVIGTFGPAALKEFRAHLLLGVTGSGKTEVYLHLVHAALQSARQALVLVPEINLTPQLEQTFRARFPDTPIAIMHSALADNERALAWLAAQHGEARIVLGTRLAVFTPMPALGLIIVDEEHDASFKQQDGVRYSARDLAVVRASQLRCPIVLGSATPSIESFANAISERYLLSRLPERARANAVLPTVRLVDLRAETVTEGIAASVLAALRDCKARGEQSLVFLNRRGYAPVLACGACGWVGDCDRCAAHLVVHLKERRLRCHHCGFDQGIPRNCPTCGNVDLVPFGRGTQRVEDTLALALPEARVLRIDSDSMRAKDRWRATIDSIHAGEVDVLVGTQILAKGHDFPRLTLVAILNADAALMAADYRAPERLFAQLQQVAGRAGRADLPGEVLIQTQYPEHPTYRALVKGDYESFARVQLEERTQAGFPPAVSEAVIRAEAPAIADALRFLHEALADSPARPDELTIYDPVAMSLSRLAGWERAHVLIQARSRKALQGFLAAWTAQLYERRTPTGVRWHVEVDPIEF